MYLDLLLACLKCITYDLILQHPLDLLPLPAHRDLSVLPDPLIQGPAVELS